MAIKTIVASRLAEATQTPLGTWEKTLLALAPEFIPHARQGGEGAGSLQLRPYQLAALLLAAASLRPADAKRDTRRLADLVCVSDEILTPLGVELGWSTPPPTEDEDPLTLILWAAGRVDGLRDPHFRQQIKRNFPTWELALSVDPPEAIVRFDAVVDGKLSRHEMTFRPTESVPAPPPARPRRWTSISLDLLCVAGELWEDSFAKINADRAGKTTGAATTAGDLKDDA